MTMQRILSPEVDEIDEGLWSNAIRAGDFLFISGQVSREFHGKPVVGDTAYDQAHHIFTRIQHLLKAATAQMNQIVKPVIYVTDISENQEVWRARREFFHGIFPTSTPVQVAALGQPEQPDADRHQGDDERLLAHFKTTDLNDRPHRHAYQRESARYLGPISDQPIRHAVPRSAARRLGEDRSRRQVDRRTAGARRS